MKKRKLIPLITCSILALGAAIPVSTYLVKGRSSATFSWSDVTLEENYSLNDIISIPDRTFEYGGATYAASHILGYPNGKQTANSEVSLNQVGTYTLYYTAMAEDKVYNDVLEFVVTQGPYYFETSTSSVTYGHSANATSDGLLLSLYREDTFHFTEHIDFTNVNGNNVLVEGYIAPSVQGTPDFTTLTLTFTDSLDPSYTLTMEYYAYEYTTEGGWSFSAAGGQNQELTGFLSSANMIHVGDHSGASMQTSFSSVYRKTIDGKLNSTNQADDLHPFQFFFDNETMNVYGADKRFVTCLANTNYYPTFWTGFPSGKADLSITASGNNSNYANICITKVLGHSTLENMTFSDNNGPTITVDTPYEKMPDGLINKSYKIPSATAVDDYSGKRDVEVEVIYNFASDKQTNISIENGTFTPKKVGSYIIRYKAIDASNNVSYLAKVVNVYDSLEPISFELPKDRVTSASIGESISFAPPSNMQGGSGELNYTIEAKQNGTTYSIDKSFVPNNTGDWIISYIVTDYIGQSKRISYTLNVVMEQEAVIIGTPSFLTHYISDCSYTLPEVEVYVKDGAGVKKEKASIRVTDTNGSVDYESDATFVPNIVANGDSITFNVVYNNSSLYQTTAKGVLAFEKVEDDGLTYRKLKTENFFETNNANVDVTDAGVSLKATDSNMSAMFINPLSPKNISLTLNKVSSKSNNASLFISLMDITDQEKVVTLKVVTDGDATKVIYDNEERTFDSSFHNPDENAYTFAFDGKSVALGSFKKEVSNYDNGKLFDGFNGHKVYLSIGMENIGSNDSFTLVRILNHYFTDSVSDKAEPQIQLEEEFAIAHEINDIVKIPSASSYDVLSPNLDFTLTVTGPNGEMVKDINDNVLENVDPTLDHYAKLDVYGEYRIYYSSKESKSFTSKGNENVYMIYMTVFDTEAPVITIQSKLITEVKTGEYIVVPAYKVTDNATKEEDIIRIVSILSPNGLTYYLTGDVNALKVTVEGIHEVHIMAVDESGNVASYSYQVNVTKGGK